MADKEETGAGEQDDVSFLRTVSNGGRLMFNTREKAEQGGGRFLNPSMTIHICWEFFWLSHEHAQ